jgi:hypothetical protein
MKINEYVYVPHKKERSTGVHIVRNAFYIPDPSVHESHDLYKGYDANDLFGLEIVKIVPMDEALARAFNW